MLSWFNFFAGVALMLYGIRTLRKGTERLCGARLRQLIQGATQSRRRALVAGLTLAILTPSSTAVALLSVEAIHAGYVTVQQALALMLGANIGFTVPVQLLAFKFYIYNAVFIALGVPLSLFCSRQQWRGAGQMLLGIGLLLLSIQILTAAVAPLRQNADVVEVMRVLASYPVLVVFFAVLLKMMLQSATATIGIAIALSGEAVLPASSAVAVVIGANIGIALTALIAGFRRADTRRMALGNLLFKVAGAAACFPLIPQIVRALGPVSPQGTTQLVANAHTLFNVALAVVFLPLVPVIGRLVEKLAPEREAAGEKFGPRYLDGLSLESPALALGQATREILHMADHVRAMLRSVHRAFRENDLATCKQVQESDDKVDLLNTEIKGFLTRISEQALRVEESRREIALLSFANELETIGDIADKNLSELAEKKITQNLTFSKEGWQELDEFFQMVLQNFEIAVSAFTGQDRVLAEQLLRHKHRLNEQERELRNRHFRRLHAGLIESVETSAIHLDVLTNLKHINSHLTAVAYPILEAKSS
jgi:phosphate:Na+ symporter